jgi:hypothetical protein
MFRRDVGRFTNIHRNQTEHRAHILSEHTSPSHHYSMVTDQHTGSGTQI